MLLLINSTDVTFQECSQVCAYCEETNLNYDYFLLFWVTQNHISSLSLLFYFTVLQPRICASVMMHDQ